MLGICIAAPLRLARIMPRLLLSVVRLRNVGVELRRISAARLRVIRVAVSLIGLVIGSWILFLISLLRLTLLRLLLPAVLPCRVGVVLALLRCMRIGCIPMRRLLAIRILLLRVRVRAWLCIARVILGGLVIGTWLSMTALTLIVGRTCLGTLLRRLTRPCARTIRTCHIDNPLQNSSPDSQLVYTNRKSSALCPGPARPELPDLRISPVA